MQLSPLCGISDVQELNPFQQKPTLSTSTTLLLKRRAMKNAQGVLCCHLPTIRCCLYRMEKVVNNIVAYLYIGIFWFSNFKWSKQRLAWSSQSNGLHYLDVLWASISHRPKESIHQPVNSFGLKVSALRQQKQY